MSHPEEDPAQGSSSRFDPTPVIIPDGTLTTLADPEPWQCRNYLMEDDAWGMRCLRMRDHQERSTPTCATVYGTEFRYRARGEA